MKISLNGLGADKRLQKKITEPEDTAMLTIQNEAKRKTN